MVTKQFLDNRTMVGRPLFLILVGLHAVVGAVDFIHRGVAAAEKFGLSPVVVYLGSEAAALMAYAALGLWPFGRVWVEASDLRVHMALGAKWRIPLGIIAEVTQTPDDGPIDNPFAKLRFGAWFWGRRGVRIVLTDGVAFQIGCEDPTALRAKIESHQKQGR